jgi:enoyl-CoA hydratase/carnithine racemase
MCVCDFAVTHPDAKVGYPEVDLGVCPAVVAPWLVNKVGPGAARRILLMGGTMTGAEAHALGLASHLAPAERLDEATAELAARLASGGPLAVRATKAWLNEVDGPRLPELVRRGAEISAEVMSSEEARATLSRALGAG